MDLKQAYLQLEVDEDCKDLLTINTHRGLYRYNRMAFGIASAPAIWQRTIEQILSGIPGTQCLLDDMIITGSTDEEHLNNLESDSVTFCGHVIDKHGLHKTPDKIEAIRNAPAPENVSQLKSILGLINYYAKFLPDLSATLSPLHNLLRKDITWRWTKECQEAVRQGYEYEIEFRGTAKHANADSLSRLPLKSTEVDTSLKMVESFHIAQMEAIPVSNKQVQQETRNDRVLGLITTFTQDGWNTIHKDGEYAPYYSRRNELTVHQGCLMWGVRVIIPNKLRSQVLGQIHEGHLGVVKMKALARSFVWWPGIDQDIEKLAKACNGCQLNQNSPKGAPLNAWEWPSKPWDRVHIDFAGPFLGSMFLIMVDAHSKWPEVIKMKNITSESTINVLRTIFSRNGIPSRICGDNGPQFTSQEFENFMQLNGIKHIRSAPYHPSTNGLAERFVQTFKQAMKSSSNDSGTVSKKLAQFLLAYRNTKHSTTNETPAKLMIGRDLKTRMNLLRPNIENQVQTKQEEMCDRRKTYQREFNDGQSVVVRDYRNKNKWTPGTISTKTGPVSYQVQIDPTTIWRRHADQIIDSNISSTEQSISEQTTLDNHISSEHVNPTENEHRPQKPEEHKSNQPTTPVKRYPTRERKSNKLKDFIYN
ncbi:unnamed protein product [Mytilus edulis]|uniref:Integrase catalytic domain-containing protein n=1 Tax=Mytilus edulis TaxID=6550 RepID=A0A8S3S0F3_MYTED|nr:unnamed protein product [Mytilus edulis]